MPNITVDSPANPGTVLVLDHGPGVHQLPGLRADLSADMAFRYLDHPVEHAPATAVSCDHLDADALVSVLALTEPNLALPHRSALVELARADDFAVFRDRAIARAAMALRTFVDPERSPIASELRDLGPVDLFEVTVARTLPLLVDLVTEIDHYRQLWADEDDELTTSLQVFERGLANVIEHPVDKLSVIQMLPGVVDVLQTKEPHRALHPMAVNTMARGARQLTTFGQHFHYIDRAESWFQYRGRQIPPRIDLREVAQDLNFLEGSAVWVATPPSVPVAWLTSSTESSLDARTVTTLLIRQFRSAPPAWDPFASNGPQIPIGEPNR